MDTVVGLGALPAGAHDHSPTNDVHVGNLACDVVENCIDGIDATLFAAIDVTERKKAAEELVKAGLSLKMLFLIRQHVDKMESIPFMGRTE